MLGDVAPDARTHRLMLPVLGSSALGDRLPLNCGCTLVVTTNPKIQGSRGGSLYLPNRGTPRRQEKCERQFRLALSRQDRYL